MADRNPVPTLWLMTDERMGDGLWRAMARLPRGAGVVFRHHATPPPKRRALYLRVRRIARARGLTLIVAGAPLPGGDGVHGRGRTRGLRTWPAHCRAEALAGKRARADALFVSPLYPTRSHPGASTLGPRKAAAIGHGLGLPIIALGGMNARAFVRISRLGFDGWAAIDAWSR